MIKQVLQAIISLADTAGKYVAWKSQKYLDEIEDEIDDISTGDLDLAAKLRIKRLLERKQRLIANFSIIRPASDTSDSGKDI